MSLALVVAVVAGLIGVTAGMLIAARAMHTMRQVGSPGTEVGLGRLRALVGTGLEQTIVGTLAGLDIGRGATDRAYGELYFESDADHRVLIRSRSMLDRGLLALLTFTSGGRRTTVTYSIVRLPSDETVHAAVLHFEVTLVQAIRRLDSDAEVHLSGSALRGVERSTAGADPLGRQ